MTLSCQRPRKGAKQKCNQPVAKLLAPRAELNSLNPLPAGFSDYNHQVPLFTRQLTSDVTVSVLAPNASALAL